MVVNSIRNIINKLKEEKKGGIVLVRASDRNNSIYERALINVATDVMEEKVWRI